MKRCCAGHMMRYVHMPGIGALQPFQTEHGKNH